MLNIGIRIHTVQRRGKNMDRQVMKGVRLPAAVVQKIEQIVEKEGSTFSQFIRTAAMKELGERKRRAA
jgi:metal-responsive CopG/Arc/MetJ family transcriptional regulator